VTFLDSAGIHCLLWMWITVSLRREKFRDDGDWTVSYDKCGE
jgi:hypothetical protein